MFQLKVKNINIFKEKQKIGNRKIMAAQSPKSNSPRASARQAGQHNRLNHFHISHIVPISCYNYFNQNDAV